MKTNKNIIHDYWYNLCHKMIVHRYGSRLCQDVTTANIITFDAAQQSSDLVTCLSTIQHLMKHFHPWTATNINKH